jgi:hypothetical protein
MNVYIYQAALLCEACGRATRLKLIGKGKSPADRYDESSYDSDDFPKGPESDGGGESDSPEHCDHCKVFLANPLTALGRDALDDMCREALRKGEFSEAALEWIEFYSVDLPVLLDAFTRGYVESALWSSSDQGGEPLDKNYDIDDITPEALATMAKDFANFQEASKELLEQSELTDDEAGHDFWLTRNGHGVGFWDRGLGEIGDKLSEACKPYGTSDLYVGDDGRLYVSP